MKIIVPDRTVRVTEYTVTVLEDVLDEQGDPGSNLEYTTKSIVPNKPQWEQQTTFDDGKHKDYKTGVDPLDLTAILVDRLNYLSMHKPSATEFYTKAVKHLNEAISDIQQAQKL